MGRICLSGLVAGLLVSLYGGLAAAAETAGQADLDKALGLKVTAESLADLEKVAKLCESALQKGLDEPNQKFAQQLLSSTLYKHATRLCAPILEQSPPDRRWPMLRQFALKDLREGHRDQSAVR